jgi:ligand-binding sensor domain-containing protein
MRCLRQAAQVALMTFVGWHSTYALDPSKQLSQYAHHAWTTRDGVFSGSVFAISQSADGYLWIGTTSGLFRFDGVRFVNWESVTGLRLPNESVFSLFSAEDGSLWIGTVTGLFRWWHGELIENPKIRGVVQSIKEDHSGTLWIAQIDSQGPFPVCSITNAVTACFKRPDGVIGDSGCCYAVAEAADGTIWASGRNLLMYRSSGSFRSLPIDTITARAPTGGPSFLAAGAGANLWVGVTMAGTGLGLRRLVKNALADANIAGFDADQLRIASLFVDKAGSLWMGTGDHGLYRWSGERVDHFDRHDGLSGDFVHAVFEDREGTVWVGTQGGLDSFHDTAVTTFSPREGIADPLVSAVSASSDGGVWISTNGGLYHLRDGTLSSVRAGKGLPGVQVTALLTDPDGRLWLGIDQTLWTYWQGKFTRLSRPDGANLGIVNDLAEDTEGNVWATGIGPPRTLFRIHDQRVVESYPAPAVPAVRRVAADPKTGIWLGLVNGEFANFHNGSLTMMHSSLHPKLIFGRRQASCRINGFIYAASFMMFCGLRFFSPLVSIFSGFRCTTSMCCQLRVAFFQRSGFLARATA